MRLPLSLRAMQAALAVLACAAFAAAESSTPQVPNDWDLFMLKLVNGARTNPAGDNLRWGTDYTNPPVAPLAYSPLLGRAASNHNQWMSANADNPAIYDPNNNTSAPDSFAHFETLNAGPSGPPASNTPHYTGAGIGDRISHAGFVWSNGGENLYWRANSPEITPGVVTSNHAGWWRSTGHRKTMMNPNYTSFGHDLLITFDTFAAQAFSRPRESPSTFILGVLYDDIDNSGAWEPHNSDDPAREGLGEVPYRVFSSTAGNQIGTAETYDNGSFSFPVDSGSYDLLFQLDEHDLWVRNISLSGSNVDIGDISIGANSAQLAGDFNGDGMVNLADYTVWRDHLGTTDDSLLHGNGDATPGVGVGDYHLWRDSFARSPAAFTSLAAVPEPGSKLLLLAGLALLLVSTTRGRRLLASRGRSMAH